VFVVWEPILMSDVAPPTTGDLARCNDARAQQFWDERTLVSQSLSDAHGPRRNGVAWDYVALYPPGASWDDRLPAAAFEGGPVVEVAGELRDRITSR
jgi:hypothetical protein